MLTLLRHAKIVIVILGPLQPRPDPLLKPTLQDKNISLTTYYPDPLHAWSNSQSHPPSLTPSIESINHGCFDFFRSNISMFTRLPERSSYIYIYNSLGLCSLLPAVQPIMLVPHALLPPYLPIASKVRSVMRHNARHLVLCCITLLPHRDIENKLRLTPRSPRSIARSS